MGKEGAKFVKDEFNWERVAKNFLRIVNPYVKVNTQFLYFL